MAGRPKENKSKPGTSSRSRAEKSPERVQKRAESCASGLSHTHKHTSERWNCERGRRQGGGDLCGSERARAVCSSKNFAASIQTQK